MASKRELLRAVFHFSLLFLGLALILTGGYLISDISNNDFEQESTTLFYAEDLWGNPIDLSNSKNGLLIINPFSTSNCGYCLVDGFFIKENYYKNTVEENGTFLGMCLFNPQLDIYAFLKHFRKNVQVITSPPSLDRFHGAGFPWMMVFRDQKRIFNGPIWPYEKQFDLLNEKIWGGEKVLHPTSPFQMAVGLVFENMSNSSIGIVPDNDERLMKRMQTKFQDCRGSIKFKYDSQVTLQDYRDKHLFIVGNLNKSRFNFLDGIKVPIKISDKIIIGEHEFEKRHIGVTACFPNPFNTSKYIGHF